MKKIIIILAIFWAATGAAQNVKTDSKGNFIALSTGTRAKDSTATGKTYTDSKSKTWPVFKSASGKYFVPRNSKKGNYYRMYLKLN